MAVDISPFVWWFWLTTLTAVVVACYEINTENSEEYMRALFVKLSIISIAAAFYYVISYALCTKSQSLNTHKLIASNTNTPKRDKSLIFGTLRLNKASLKWSKLNHLKFLETQTSLNAHYGAYTVLRTVDKYYLFQFNMHLQRLLNTIHEQIQTETHLNIGISLQILRRLLVINIRNGLDQFYDDYMIDTNESRITIYIDINPILKSSIFGSNYDINDDEMEELLTKCVYIHFGALIMAKRPISACIRIGRETFKDSIKTTKWNDERKRFRKDIDDLLGLNEIIMTEVKGNNDGFIMEGLSSNIAVLCSDLSLLTPAIDDGVLNGTMRGFVIDVLEEIKENGNIEEIESKYGIIPHKIVYGKPLFSDIMKWKSVVMMSTSRLLLPIDHLYIDIEDDVILKMLQNDAKHEIFNVKKSMDSDCGFRKIVYSNQCVENMRVMIEQRMKSHSVYVGSVFER